MIVQHLPWVSMKNDGAINGLDMCSGWCSINSFATADDN